MRETEVVGSNPGNGGKSRMCAYSCKKIARLRCALGKENIVLIFIHSGNIYFNTQKNDARHLCVDINAGLRLPYVTG